MKPPISPPTAVIVNLLAHVMCANCHSLEPNGALRPLPKLLGYSSDPKMIQAYLDGALYHGAIPYMPRMPLPEPERAAIALYLASLSAPATAKLAENATTTPAKGVN